MNKMKMVILFLLIFFSCLYSQEDKFKLEYKFQNGERLQYKIERHDSITTSAAGQEMKFNTTIFMLQSLVVEEAGKDKSFTLKLKTDSVWTDKNTENMINTSSSMNRMGERRSQRRTFSRAMGRFGNQQRERKITITTNGRQSQDSGQPIPFLITLPEKEVSVNDTWDFEIKFDNKGRSKGTTTIKGECLLYDIEKKDSKNIAVIVANSETNSESQFKFQIQERTISGSNVSKSTQYSIVYFDIDKGRIVEIVSEETSESTRESGGMTTPSTRKSNISIKLLSG